MLHIQHMARPTQYPIKKLVNLTEAQGQAVHNFRFDQRIASENEAIRRLIEIGLEAVQKDAPAQEPEA